MANHVMPNIPDLLRSLTNLFSKEQEFSKQEPLTYRYSLMGVSVESNFQFGTLPQQKLHTAKDPLRFIHTVDMNEWHEILQRDWQPTGQITDIWGNPEIYSWICSAGYLINYPNRTVFFLEKDISCVKACKYNGQVLDFVADNIPFIIGILQHLNGLYVLHGSAIRYAGKGLILLGQSGAGKSSLETALALRGAAIIADDIVCIGPRRENWPILPGIETVRLSPDATSFFGLSEQGIPVEDGSGKVMVDFSNNREGVCSTTELAAIYCLNRLIDQDSIQMPELEVCGARESLVWAIKSSFGLLVDPPVQQGLSVQKLGRLSCQFGVKRLTYPSSFAEIENTCKCIEQDLDVLS